MIVAIILLIVGFVLLIKGADWFVDGASALAANFKVPKMVIALTVVAFAAGLNRCNKDAMACKV